MLQKAAPQGTTVTHTQILAVRNAAFPSAGAAIAPGTIVSVFGANLARGEGTSNAPANSLADAEVYVNGRSTVLYYASPNQINDYIPGTVPTGTAQVEVRVGEQRSAPQTVQLIPSAPALFRWNRSRQIAGGVEVRFRIPEAARAGPQELRLRTGTGSSNPVQVVLR